MDYGNPLATDQSDAANVWDSNYKGVWHMNEVSGTAYDATSNNNDLTDNVTATGKDGKIGSGQDFNTSDNYTISDSSTLSITGTNITVSGWVNPKSLSDSSEIWNGIFSSLQWPTHGYWLGLVGYGGAIGRLEAYIENPLTENYANPSMSFDNWYYVAFTFDGSYIRTYKNGSSLNSVARSQPITDGIADQRVWGSSKMTGAVDELHVVSTARSANWIAAEYKNQGLNTFTAVGGEGTLDGFGWRRTITFDNSAQAENLANFPVMIKANNSELNWSGIVQADLDDVIFVDSNNTTLLNWEWETKNSSGESIAWVKVPQ
jgi:hypothetical protein